MHRWRLLLGVAVPVIAMLGGCVGMEEVMAARDQAVKMGERLDAEAERWESVAASLDEGDPGRAEAEAIAGEARAHADLIEAGVRQVDMSLDGANNQGAMPGGVLDSVLPWVPAPARIPLVLGAGLLASVARLWQLRRGLASVVKGLDVAMRDDPNFAERFKAHANTFRATQTDLARRIVDRVAGQGVTTRLGG